MCGKSSRLSVLTAELFFYTVMPMIITLLKHFFYKTILILKPLTSLTTVCNKFELLSNSFEIHSAKHEKKISSYRTDFCKKRRISQQSKRTTSIIHSYRAKKMKVVLRSTKNSEITILNKFQIVVPLKINLVCFFIDRSSLFHRLQTSAL